VAGDAGEQAIFRVDHVLGMATAQNLLALRQNRVLAPVWSGTHVEQVEVLWEETLALEGRAGYYDGAGALKDVLQNHMLQVLCLAAMEPPANGDERELRDRKVDVLRSVRPLTSRRARYGAGRLSDTGGASGASVPAYADEDGVDPARGTESFVELTVELATERWQGTTFVLRAGKALRRRRKGIVIRFRSSDARAANELWIGIDGPSDVVLRLTAGAFGRPAHVELRGEPPAEDLRAYARVLLDVLTGGSTLSVRGDEAEWAWRVVTPVLEAWRTNRVPLEEYPAGSDGPCR
jgi:glucose-6-phosphate 1-dehydrogenase